MRTKESVYASQILAGVDMTAILGGIALVIGLGTVGEIIATLLAMNGWGLIILVDNGRIEIRNIGRSIHYLPDTLGLWKAQVLAPELERLRDNIECVGIVGDAKDLGDAFYRHASVVFEAVDFMLGKMWVGRRARMHKKTCISVALGTGERNHDDWETSLWLPDKRCRECDWSKRDYEMANHLKRSCDEEVPREGPKAGMAPSAAFQVAGEVVKQAMLILQGKPPTFEGYLRYCTNNNQTTKYGPKGIDPECQGHEPEYDVVYVEYDGGTSVEELYSMASEELGLLIEDIAIQHRSRKIATSKICSNSKNCDYEEDFFGLQKWVEEEEEKCPECGSDLLGRDWLNDIPISDRPLSFFEVDQFIYLPMVTSNGHRFHLASTRCRTEEDFRKEVLDIGEAVYSGGEDRLKVSTS